MGRLKSKTAIIVGLAILALIAAWNWRLQDPGLLASLRNLTFDTYQRLAPREPLGQPIRIIDIDEASIAEFGQWPWPRTQIAQIVNRLDELGAAVIGLDIVFSEPDRTGPTGFIRQLREREWPGGDALEAMVSRIPDNDTVLAQAIENSGAVLGFFVEARSRDSLPPRKAGYVVAGDREPHVILPKAAAAVANLAPMQTAAAGIGAITIGQENDDLVRRVPMFWSDGAQFYPAFSIETLRVVQGASTFVLRTSSGSGDISAGKEAMTAFKVGQFEVPVDASGNFLLHFARNDPALYVSARDLLERDAAELAPLIEGYIVFIGTSAAGLRDLRVTALGETVPGVYVHAQIVDQILSGAFLSRPDWATGAEIAAMGIVSVVVVAIVTTAGALVSSLAGAFCAMLILAASWFAFSRYGLLIDPLFALMTGGMIFLMTTVLMFAFTERERRFVRGAFQRYLAPDLLTKLEANPESLKLGGEIRDMTLMFMDVRGFTPISEKLTPEQLVAFLNSLLSPLSETIQGHEGAIDKYIGDSIMAFWNAPLDVADHPRKAARAALAMLDAVQVLNRDDAFGFHSHHKGLGDVEIGIGLNTGQGCVGNVGSLNRFDYSVVGDTVNVAARIESSCKEIGWPVLLSHSTAQACDGFAMLKAGSIALKGKSEPAPLHALIGDETLAATEEWQELLQAHEALLDAIAAGQTDQARSLAQRCRMLSPVPLESFYSRLLENTGEQATA